ncbi:Putative disease resistance protein RGA4 [Triticum urartu]|uniref:Putative disease resistance protein RGA4 n=1 Tax=Triticum urartu TaxID=4572 RepID=M7Z419_TRIUA|nr:Putative disease resistance protein RGA4 [Triticum urartu]
MHDAAVAVSGRPALTPEHAVELPNAYNLFNIMRKRGEGRRKSQPAHMTFFAKSDPVVQSWSAIMEKLERDVQLEQVRVCAEIAMKCRESNPARRPDSQHIISALDGRETIDGYIESSVITSQQFNPEIFNATMGALWLRYQQLNPDLQRSFKYCSIFPKRSKLRRDVLVRLWIAQGFIKTSATEDMEDVAESYFQELVSCSFLQQGGEWYDTWFTIPDLLHNLLDKMSGTDCFRIENARSQRGEGWKGDVPQDVCHLLVENYDGALITEKILGLKNLQTLIIYVVERGTTVEEKVIDSICKRLHKLRVLAVAFSREHLPIIQPNKFLVPESISHLKDLCHLAFRTFECTVILPSTLTNTLHHIQLLDFGNHGHCEIWEFTLDNLINLRYIICENLECPNIGRLISLQTLPSSRFTIRNEKGYEIKQLRDLNKLRSSLEIYGLENVKSKEEAVEANLAAKDRLKQLKLEWGDDGTRCSSEVEAEVHEGLCPPVGLEELIISGYQSSRNPDWMVGKQKGGPKNLQKLVLFGWSQPGSCPELEAFVHLRVLWLGHCRWDTLPGNIEHLTSLKELEIEGCLNIRSLPTLPRSLEKFCVAYCSGEFTKSCQTVRHPNWQKIKHTPDQRFEDPACKSAIPFSAFFFFCIRKNGLSHEDLLLTFVMFRHPFAILRRKF